MDPGTGKTRVAVEALQKWIKEDDVRLILVVNILTGLHVWVQGWHEWADEPVLFVDLHETGVEGLEAARDLAEAGSTVICLINFEAAWQLGHARVPRIRKGEKVRVLEPVDTTLFDVDWDAVIIDESTGIKSPSATVSKFFLNKIKPKARYRMILTGSAYTKRPLDVFSQVKFILPKGSPLLPKTFTEFKIKYAIPHPYIRGAVLGYQRLDELAALLNQCCFLCKKAEMVDLPPTVSETREILLPPKIRKIYKDITDELYADLEEFEKNGGTVSVNHVFSVMRKQSQITAGYVRKDPVEGELEGEIMQLHDLKIKEVLGILENRGGAPTIIVTQSNHEEIMLANAIQAKFGFRPKILNGSVKGSAARLKMIKEGADAPALIVKESVGSKSADMRWADMTIFYSLSPNTINYDQMLARNDRGGQTKSITYIYLLCKNTADTRIMKILKDNLNTAKEIERNWRALL